MADNAINSLIHTEQMRGKERLMVGRDPITEGYAAVDANIDGKVAVRQYVWDTGTLSWVAMSTDTSVPTNYDEIDITYDGSGNIETVTYKLLGDVVTTLTLTYTDGNLTKIVRT